MYYLFVFYLTDFSIIFIIAYCITLQMCNGPHSHPNLSCILRLMCHIHSPRGYEKVYYSHTEAFWGKQNRFTTGCKNGLKEQGDKACLAFIVVGCGTKEKFPHAADAFIVSVPTGTKGRSAWAFLLACP